MLEYPYLYRTQIELQCQKSVRGRQSVNKYHVPEDQRWYMGEMYYQK